jgi:hypothetical protein
MGARKGQGRNMHYQGRTVQGQTTLLEACGDPWKTHRTIMHEPQFGAETDRMSASPEARNRPTTVLRVPNRGTGRSQNQWRSRPPPGRIATRSPSDGG